MDIQSFVLHCRYPFPMSISAIELTEGLYIRIIIALYHLQFLSSTVYSLSRIYQLACFRLGCCKLAFSKPACHKRNCRKLELYELTCRQRVCHLRRPLSPALLYHFSANLQKWRSLFFIMAKAVMPPSTTKFGIFQIVFIKIPFGTIAEKQLKNPKFPQNHN